MPIAYTIQGQRPSFKIAQPFKQRKVAVQLATFGTAHKNAVLCS